MKLLRGKWCNVIYKAQGGSFNANVYYLCKHTSLYARVPVSKRLEGDACPFEVWVMCIIKIIMYILASISDIIKTLSGIYD